jgi:anti-sigma factor RsiW
VTKADEGVAPGSRGGAQIVTHASSTSAVSAPELTHEEIREQLSDYLDGALPDGDRRRVEKHLGWCQPCSRFLDSLRTTVGGIHVLPPPKAPARARARILEQAGHEHERSRQAQPQSQPAASDE